MLLRDLPVLHARPPRSRRGAARSVPARGCRVDWSVVTPPPRPGQAELVREIRSVVGDHGLFLIYENASSDATAAPCLTMSALGSTTYANCLLLTPSRTQFEWQGWTMTIQHLAFKKAVTDVPLTIAVSNLTDEEDTRPFGLYPSL
jgi:hypothetical protein